MLVPRTYCQAEAFSLMQVAWLTVQWCEEIPKGSENRAEEKSKVNNRSVIAGGEVGGEEGSKKSNHPACQDHKSK